MAKINVIYPSFDNTQDVIYNSHSTSCSQHYRGKLYLKILQLSFQYAPPNPYSSIHYWYSNERLRMSWHIAAPWYQTQYPPPRSKKLGPQQLAQHVEPGAEIVICSEIDEQLPFVRYKGNPPWLFYDYDRIQKRVLAHDFNPRNVLTLQQDLVFLKNLILSSKWPTPAGISDVAGYSSPCSLYKYTRRIECHNLNLSTHLKRVTRKVICFSTSE